MANLSASNESPSLSCIGKNEFIDNRILLSMWRIVYWTAQILTWIVLPLMQSYVRAGEFSTFGKLRSAVYNNLVYYGMYLIIFFFLMVYAAFKGVSLNAEHLKIILISASNTWGLFLLVVLLGYGLVEVPRHLLHMSNKGYLLSRVYFDIDCLSAEKNDAEDAVSDVYREANAVRELLRDNRLLSEHCDTIMSKFSPDVIESISSSHTSGSSLSFGDLDINYISNEAYLIRLHQRVISTVDNYRRIQAQWVALIRHALYLENVQQAEITQQFCRVEKGVRWSQSFNKLQYCWHVILKRPLCKVLGWISVFLTLIVMWSECTFFIIHPQLSIAAILVHAASRGYHYIYIEACTTLIIFYLCVCAYYTVFRLKIYRYYHLDAHHMTNENSLLFSAILLCRLTPPICLNVLGMIHMDSHITSDAKFGVETQFTMLMGHLDIIPILAEGINIYLPIFIVILCLGTWLRIGTRFLHSLGIEQFFVKDEMTAELIQGGKALVSLERNKIGRASEREKRDQYWAERFARKADASSFDLRNQSLHRSDNEIMSDERRMPLQVREYSDREPIISADEHEEYPTRDGVMHWRHNEMSAFRPPTNMFDDL